MISGVGRFLNLGMYMYKGYYKGLLKEQVLLLYQVKSGTPKLVAPPLTMIKNTKMWMLKNTKNDY